MAHKNFFFNLIPYVQNLVIYQSHYDMRSLSFLLSDLSEKLLTPNFVKFVYVISQNIYRSTITV